MLPANSVRKMNIQNEMKPNTVTILAIAMQYTTYVQSILQGNTPFTAHIAMKGRVAQFREKSVDVLLSSIRVCVRRRSGQAILGTEHRQTGANDFI